MLTLRVPRVANLPNEARWLDPGSMGPGDALVEQLIRENGALVEQRITPENWREEALGKAYDYVIPPLQQLRTTLEQSKKRMDEINSDPHTQRQMEFVADKLRPWHLLKTRDGILANEYGSPVVTNAYLKMIELLPLVCPPPAPVKREKKTEDVPPKKEKKAVREARPTAFHTFHMAEAPGNFILALNHYLYSTNPDLFHHWSWRANTMTTLRPRVPKRERQQAKAGDGYLGDTYGIIARYRERWLLGADGDGDITSPDNLRSFAQDQPPVQLVTSDVKVVPANMDYSKEELINIPVQMAHLVGSLLCLAPGGNMVLKEFTKFESMSVCLLMVVAHCFEEVFLVKPESSRAANSEIYVVAKNYDTRPTERQFELLLNALRFIRFLPVTDSYPALFRYEDVAHHKNFLKAHLDVQETLVTAQCKALAENYRLLEELQASGEEKMLAERRLKNQKQARIWLDQHPLRALPTEHLLIEARVPRGSRPRVPEAATAAQ